ncbi:MAG: leucine-rich repeat domain-containing protein [Simkaniaceae bacterium]|nr:leucine-rich repeat domain-containing protein [Simkaniaceae bacterium]
MMSVSSCLPTIALDSIQDQALMKTFEPIVLQLHLSSAAEQEALSLTRACDMRAWMVEHRNSLNTITRCNFENRDLEVLPIEMDHLQGLKELSLGDNRLRVLPYTIASRNVCYGMYLEQTFALNTLFLQTGLRIADLARGEPPRMREVFLSMQELNVALGCDVRKEVLMRYNECHLPLPIEWDEMKVDECYGIEIEALYHAYETVIKSEAVSVIVQQIQQDQSVMCLFKEVIQQLDGIRSDDRGLKESAISLKRAHEMRTWMATHQDVLSEMRSLMIIADHIETIPPEIAFFKGLTRLSLACNRLAEVPVSIETLTRLTKLDLSGNRLTEFPRALCALIQLEKLDFGDHYLRMGDVPSEIRFLTKLRKLKLACCRWPAFPLMLCQLTGLLVLDLAYAELSTLPLEFQSLTGLTKLTFNLSDFTEFPSVLCSLIQLEELDFQSSGIKAVPPEIRFLTKLRKLNFEGNRLATLPQEIGQLVQLTHLELSRNRLRILPETVCDLTQLIGLDLSKNDLQRLPEKIGQLSALQFFKLSNNFLTYLPDSVRGLKVGFSLFPQSSYLSNVCMQVCVDILQTGVAPVKTGFASIENLNRTFGVDVGREVLMRYNNASGSIPVEWDGVFSRDETCKSYRPRLYRAYREVMESEMIRSRLFVGDQHNKALVVLAKGINSLFRNAYPKEFDYMRFFYKDPGGERHQILSWMVAHQPFLNRITSLTLYHEDLEVIPPEIALLRNLTDLNLSFNRLS